MERPIGYWLKHVDGLIEAGFLRSLASEGLTRRGWQVLNVLADGGDIEESLRPFWTAGESGIEEVLADLAARGWVSDVEPYQLTDVGWAAHAQISQTVRTARQAITAGISDDEYRQTVDVLRRMSENLQSPAGAVP